MSKNYALGIVHISDIHFGEIKDKEFKHAFDKKHGTSFSDLVSSCLSNNINLESFVRYLVISGDFVCDGSNDDDYKTAFNEVETLRKKIGIDNKNVVIVPGNHDINRKTNGLKTFINCYNEFYKDTPKKHVTDKISGCPFGKEEWLHCDDSNRVIFIPLFSVYTNKDKIPQFIKDFYAEEEFTDEENWFFDRGLIDENQLKQVEKELDNITNSVDYIKIAVLHHNPLPVTRANVKVDDYDFPSICQLANGSEVLARLQDMGVSLVLHGHTHQNSINIFSHNYKKDGLIILGASHFCKSNTSLPWITADEANGFNFIDINGFSVTPKIKLYCFTSGKTSANQLTIRIQDNSPIELHIPKLVENEIENSIGKYFLNFSEGIKRLSELIRADNERVYLLNYSKVIEWEDYFVQIWKEILEDSTTIDCLARLLFTESNTIKKHIAESLKINTYTNELIQILSKDIEFGYIKNRLSAQVPSEDKFTSFIVGLKDRKAIGGKDSQPRDVNYFMEIFRCAIDVNFKLNKGVYFQTTEINEDYSKQKFKWLCDSIFAARYLKNFNLFWLPFSIKQYLGNSLVATINSNKTTVLIGFHEDKENIKSVLHLPNDTNIVSESGRLYLNLRALMRKIIVPLSERLLVDFPLYFNGKLYIDCLGFLAKIYNCEPIWDNYKDRFQTDFSDKIITGNKNNINDITIKIRELYNWVVKNNGIEEKDKDYAIPWDNRDYDYLKNKLGESYYNVEL